MLSRALSYGAPGVDASEAARAGIGGKAWDVFNVGLYRYGVVNKASCVLFGTKVQVWCSLRVVLY